jgi:hypothetical protein
MEKRKAIIGDFLELGANAFASGLAVAIVLAAITLALAGAAQAAAGDDIPGAPATAASENEPWSPASMPIAQDRAATDVDALWATRRPEPDASMSLQVVLGLLAIACAAIVALLGRAGSNGGRGASARKLVSDTSFGRGERIRTSGLYVPNVALYQAKLHPEAEKQRGTNAPLFQL